MSRRQRGFLATLSTIFGFAVLLLAVIITLDFSLSDFIETINLQHFTVSQLITLLGTSLLASLFFLSPLWLLGGFLIFLFPNIKLVHSGIRYSGLILTGLIKWEEIESMFKLRNDTIVLVLNRRGFYLLNGLYFNKLYGLLIRHEMPVMFLSAGLGDREKILLEIMKNSGVKAIRARNDLYA